MTNPDEVMVQAMPRQKSLMIAQNSRTANRNWINLAFTPTCITAFLKAWLWVCAPATDKAVSIGSCSCRIGHRNVTCKSYSNAFPWTKARTVPNSKTPARLYSPAVVWTSSASFQNVFWQQRTAEEMKAGPRRIMFNRRSSRNKLFTIKFLIIGM